MVSEEKYSREIAAGANYITDALKEKILLVGAGNTGGHFVDRAIHNFLWDVTIIDFDSEGYTSHNFAHSSLLLDDEEDIGKLKAETLAMRATKKLSDGYKYKGKTMDAYTIGPGAIKQFTKVIACVDSVHIRNYLQDICHKANVDFIENGIDGEYGIAQVQYFDNSEDAPCYCCHSSEAENERFTSCAEGYINDIKNNIASATDILGALAADKTIVAIRNQNNNRFIKNARYVEYIDTLNSEVQITDKNPNCNCCSNKTDYSRVIEIDGSVRNMNYRELNEYIQREYNGELSPPMLLDKFITTEYCPACGKKKTINRAARFVKASEIICPECRNNKVFKHINLRIEASNEFYDLEDDLPSELQELTLFELGYPYGAYIECFDKDYNIVVFTLTGDANILEFEGE